ncbi:BgTH12-03887 [Blumeria graminis f. sp. triticale]|uniref:BgTH12-03887 n=1 Tax=Blumeria graminis f. sp. triticale TaxID=1689686 RepID=A0A9W4CVY9_BLUGR|nr:BgTH12-03887 [Blumeria graminis f. sp. triticale]
MRAKVWPYFVANNGFSIVGHSNYSFETLEKSFGIARLSRLSMW